MSAQEGPTALLDRPVTAPGVLGGGGRKLLFVTDEAALSANIGPENAANALAMIRAGTGDLVLASGNDLLTRTRQKLRDAPTIDGVVLLGGIDIVPSRILLTVPPALLAVAKARGIINRERDRFQVWSDDAYGDRDDDGVPEVPVSRIPDGKSAALVLRALSHPGVRTPLSRVRGVRNSLRPFADAIYGRLDRTTRMFQSASEVAGLPPYPLESSSLYAMLHGHWREGHVFRGEDEDGYPEAFNAREIPEPAPQIVFSGCCYGALAATQAARDAQPGVRHDGRKAEESIALTCLLKGSNAFVGCTAIHYSPDKPPFTYLGEPMHRFFWQEIAAGHPPARALLNAKLLYARNIPHLQGAGDELTLVEHKIFRQFTCLGLGW